MSAWDTWAPVKRMRTVLPHPELQRLCWATSLAFSRVSWAAVHPGASASSANLLSIGFSHQGSDVRRFRYVLVFSLASITYRVHSMLDNVQPPPIDFGALLPRAGHQ